MSREPTVAPAPGEEQPHGGRPGVPEPQTPGRLVAALERSEIEERPVLMREPRLHRSPRPLTEGVLRRERRPGDDRRSRDDRDQRSHRQILRTTIIASASPLNSAITASGGPCTALAARPTAGTRTPA